MERLTFERHLEMDEDLKKNEDSPTDDDVAAYFQFKRVKRFLGVHGPKDCDDESGPVSYGDGHSGWNR